MEAEKLLYLLKHPNLVETAVVSELQTLITKYPYFQAPKAIQLKALKNSGSFTYNQKLKETAAYTTDREVLFHFISSESFNQKTTSIKEITISKTEEISIPDAELLITPEEALQINNQKLFEPTTRKPKNITDLQKEEPSVSIQTPLEFPPNEKHSFAEWLQLTSLQPIVRKEEKTKRKKLLESPLIEKFLKNNPKIKPVKKSSPTINLAIQNNTKSEDLMTETLAKVYIAQGNYKKAIQAYKILSLKNPEKSGLFADQIRAIEKLQDNNQ